MKSLSLVLSAILLSTAASSAALIGGLDGTSIQSTFGSGSVTTGTSGALPSGWSVISGTARTFNDGNNWALIANTGNTSQYSVQYNTALALQPNTTYTLTVDIGFYTTSGTSGNGWQVSLGSLNGTTFTSLATDTGSATYAGHLHDSVFSDNAVVQFTTGATVSSDPVALRLSRTTTGPTNWLGFDNVKLDATTVPEVSSSLLGALGVFSLMVRRRR